MTTFRRFGDELDLSTWPGFDERGVAESRLDRYRAMRDAILAYADNTPLDRIEHMTGIGRKQLYRCLERCLMLHADGRIWGWRAAVPYARVQPYRRIKPPHTEPREQAGLAGSFTQLLDHHPALGDWLQRSIKQKRVGIEQISTDGRLRTRLRGLKALHDDFKGQCRRLGIRPTEYPLNRQRGAVGSLAKVTRDVCLQRFTRAARLAGATSIKGMPSERAPAASRPWDVVEFDGHRLDLRLKIVVRDPAGLEQSFEIERVWLLTVLDVCTRAVIGYHLCLSPEYSRHDVIQTIEAGLSPHRRRTFSIPGLHYPTQGGFPSTQFPQLAYATWQWFKMDNAKANLARDVRSALTDFLGCFIDVGPPHAPDDRPFVERFFRTIEQNLSARLPGYTGSGPKDLRRALSDPKGNLRLVVSLNELEELLEVAIAQYNGAPHHGLNGYSPLEAIEVGLHTHGTLLNWLPEPKRRTLFLMHEPRRVTVRGYLAQGQRPHINFFGVRYTNEVLAVSPWMLAQRLRIFYDAKDLRGVRAFTEDGAELGTLRAQGIWGAVPHDLKLRQEIIRRRARGDKTDTLSAEFLEHFVANKLKRAPTKRRTASQLAQTLRTLDQGPTTPFPLVEAAPQAVPEIVDRVHPRRAEIEPEQLTIGTGYVGTL